MPSPDPEIAVRPARPGEAGTVAHALEWLFPPPGSAPPDWDRGRATAALERAIAAEDAAVLVADDSGSVAGVCTVYRDFESARYGRRAWVEDLVVHPDRRSLGAGKALLDAAKDWARAQGCTHLELDSGEARADAHRFYEREAPSWRTTCFGWVL